MAGLRCIETRRDADFEDRVDGCWDHFANAPVTEPVFWLMGGRASENTEKFRRNLCIFTVYGLLYTIVPWFAAGARGCTDPLTPFQDCMDRPLEDCATDDLIQAVEQCVKNNVLGNTECGSKSVPALMRAGFEISFWMSVGFYSILFLKLVLWDRCIARIQARHAEAAVDGGYSQMGDDGIVDSPDEPYNMRRISCLKIHGCVALTYIVLTMVMVAVLGLNFYGPKTDSTLKADCGFSDDSACLGSSSFRECWEHPASFFGGTAGVCRDSIGTLVALCNTNCTDAKPCPK